jgi:hypothetical protein
VVGDVHGEVDALLELLRHLGYRDSGQHPKGGVWSLSEI